MGATCSGSAMSDRSESGVDPSLAELCVCVGDGDRILAFLYAGLGRGLALVSSGGEPSSCPSAAVSPSVSDSVRLRRRRVDFWPITPLSLLLSWSDTPSSLVTTSADLGARVRFFSVAPNRNCQTSTEVHLSLGIPLSFRDERRFSYARYGSQPLVDVTSSFA